MNVDYIMALNFRQRQESLGNSSIEGKKINNYGTCSVREVRTLSPQIVEMVVRQETFQTDSFKQILSKRSLANVNKENLSCNAKKLKKIKEEPSHSKSGNKLKHKSKKSSDVKQSAISINKLLKKSEGHGKKKSKQRKSMSPLRDHRDYRSGPQDKRAAILSLHQYISVNNQSKTSRQGIVGSKSERNLVDRTKNPLKSVENCYKRKQRQEKEKVHNLDKKKTKKRKNVSKVNLLANVTGRPASALTRTQSLAKQFDGLLKCPSTKRQKVKEKSQSTTIKKDMSKGKLKKQKQKKVIISNNNSKTLIEKVKVPFDFSDDSHDSPDRIMSMKYEQQKNMQKKKRDRLSFEPTKKRQKKTKNVKTQVLSPQKNLMSQNQAAISIQKVFRGYITRKYINQFKQVMNAVINIQRVWRGYQCRKKYKEIKSRKSKQNKIQMKRLAKIDQILNEAEEYQSVELNSLLEDILLQENVNIKIKNKIAQFLKKEGKISSRSSIATHSQQQMKSEKRFFEEIEKKKYNLNSPIIRCSPRLQKSELLKSPQIMIDSLLTIQQFHRDKLISNANMQRQGLANLAMKNLFSPRTHDIKRKEIEERLETDLKKFESNIGEIIKSCKDNEDLVGPIKPFTETMTPQKEEVVNKGHSRSCSPEIDDIEPINSSQRKIQDLSMELLEYYEQKTQHKEPNIYEVFDSSYQFIEEYLLTLFEYLRQRGEDFRQQFVKVMKEHKNLDIGVILKNLNTVTEDEDDDACFKLPMYKYLEQEDKEVISRQVSEDFNDSFNKLQRHQLSYHHTNLEDQYLKMLIDCINEALNQQRSNSYLFTQTALASCRDGIRMKEIEALEGEDCTKSQAQFSFFFAKAMNQIYNWAHQQCGAVIVEEAEAEAVIQMNEKRLGDYLKVEAEQHWDCYDELLEVIVGVADSIFDQIIMEEGISLYF